MTIKYNEENNMSHLVTIDKDTLELLIGGSKSEQLRLMNKVNEVSEKITAIDTKITELLGPDGRIKKLEKDVDALDSRLDKIERVSWIALGCSLAVGGILKMLGWLFGPK